MIKVTVAEAKQRFKSLSRNLQEVIFSEHLANLIFEIGAANSIPKDKVILVGEQAGLVLLGFLKPSELPAQLAEAAGLDASVAAKVAATLQNKVFTSLTGDLDKVYAPPGAAVGRGIDLDKVRAMPDFLPTVPPPAMPFGGAPSAPPFSFKATSGPAPFKPVPVPAASVAVTPSSSASPPAPLGAVSGGPAPFALRTQSEMRPIMPSGRTSLDEIHFKDVKPSASAAKPARLEIGNAPKAAPIPARTETPVSKVVHYTQWKTPPAAPLPATSAAPMSSGPVPLTSLSARPMSQPSSVPAPAADPKAVFLNRVANAPQKKDVPPPPREIGASREAVRVETALVKPASPPAPAPVAPPVMRTEIKMPSPPVASNPVSVAPMPKPAAGAPVPPFVSPPPDAPKRGGVIDLGALS